MEYISPILASLLPQAPSIILYIVGLWLSISRREQYPRIYLVAGIYFGLAVLLRLANLLYVVLPVYMSQQDMTSLDIGATFSILNIICVPFHVVMDIALLYAIFAPRNHKSDPNTPIFVGDQNA
jgi:hypothetical protein